MHQEVGKEVGKSEKLVLQRDGEETGERYKWRDNWRTCTRCTVN